MRKMARFSEQFIQQVQQATDIVDLVSNYVALKQRGREFVGLCPFHDDSKPSMSVVPAKQIFHCFACGTGGGVFKWMQLYEKMSFPEAIRELAERANIPLPRDYQQHQVSPGLARQDLVSVVEQAADFYKRNLYTSAGKQALEYARSRGLTDESIDKFGLGYALDSWDALANHLLKMGYSQDQLVAAGLCKARQKGSGCYDYFRNRLIFPIADAAGRTVAFGGRALAADEKAKYLNSPESTLFDKSSLVYGLKFARDGIVKNKQAVAVEGYLDVLLPLQAGVNNVVATLGTALTDRHVRLLTRYADETVLLFDSDAAGEKAAQRALEIFLAQKAHVRVATIPTGKDPADMVIAEGADALKSLIANAPDALEYAWTVRYKAWQNAGANPSQRKRVIDDFLRLIATSSAWGAIDSIRQQTLLQHIAHILQIPILDLQKIVAELGRKHRPGTAQARKPVANAPKVGALSNSPVGAMGNPERLVLEVILDEPGYFETAAEKIGPDCFSDAMLRSLAQWVWSKGLEGELSMENLLATEELTSFSPVITELAMTGAQRGKHEQTLVEAIARILDRQHAQEIQEYKHNLDSNDSLRALQERLKKSDVRKIPKIR